MKLPREDTFDWCMELLMAMCIAMLIIEAVFDI